MPFSPYHFELGNFKCIAIRDGGHMGSADVIFVNAPEQELAQALQVHNLEADQLRSTWTCLLIDTGEQNLLIDTGSGSGVPVGGQLLAQLEEVGYTADEIDNVFLTHGHPDHIGGCTDDDGKPIFEQARYVMGQKEYEFWSEEENLMDLGEKMANFARKNLPAIKAQVEFVEGDDDVLPGIRAIEAFGHTPGHLGLEIQSEGEVLLHLADSVLHPLHLEHPRWYANVDIQPDQMVATRYRLLEHAAVLGAIVLIYHFDFPSIGYVVQDGESWRWQSVSSE